MSDTLPMNEIFNRIHTMLNNTCMSRSEIVDNLMVNYDISLDIASRIYEQALQKDEE